MIGRVLACGYFGSKLDFDDMTGESEEAVRARSTCDTTCMTGPASVKIKFFSAANKLDRLFQISHTKKRPHIGF